MNHQEKLAFYLEDMTKRKIRSQEVAPPLFRLFWRMGLKVPPPYFLKPLTAMLVIGVPAGLAWGFGMWMFCDGRLNPEIVLRHAAFGVVMFGLPVGGLTGWSFRRKAARLALCPWENYPNQTDSQR